MSHEKQIYRYILSLMPHSQDARDVLQETAIALYNKIDDYDPSRPFAPWAFRFAYHMTLKQPGEIDSLAPILESVIS